MLTRSPVPARSPSASPSSFHTSFHYAPASPQIRSPKPPAALSRRPSTSSPLGVTKTSTTNATTTATTSSSTTTTTPSNSSSFAGTGSAAAAPSSTPTRVNATPSQAPTQAPIRERATAYEAVDAATQYSPMEPHDYFAPQSAPSKPSTCTTVPPPINGTSTDQQAAQPPLTTPAGLTSTLPTAQATTSTDPGATGASTASTVAAATTLPTTADEPPMLKAPPPLSPNKRRSSQGPESLIGESSTGGQTLPKRAKPEAAPAKVLPVRYELCAVEDIVVLIANMLSELIETNDALAMRSGHLTRFHSRTAPGISVLDYLHRLAKHATLIPPLLLSMVYYIDRLCALYPDFTINTLTVHRFLITAATVAAKGLSDSFWNNSTYARVGGVRVAELKMLELEFLHRVDWKIVPDPDVLVAYYRGLVQRSPAYVLEDEVEDEGEDDEAMGDDVDDEDEGTEASDEAGDAEAESEALRAGENNISAQGNPTPPEKLPGA